MLNLRYNEMWNDWDGANECVEPKPREHGQLVLSWRELNVFVKKTTDKFVGTSKTAYKQILFNGDSSDISYSLRYTWYNVRRGMGCGTKGLKGGPTHIIIDFLWCLSWVYSSNLILGLLSVLIYFQALWKFLRTPQLVLTLGWTIFQISPDMIPSKLSTSVSTGLGLREWRPS